MESVAAKYFNGEIHHRYTRIGKLAFYFLIAREGEVELLVFNMSNLFQFLRLFLATICAKELTIGTNARATQGHYTQLARLQSIGSGEQYNRTVQQYDNTRNSAMYLALVINNRALLCSCHLSEHFLML